MQQATRDEIEGLIERWAGNRFTKEDHRRLDDLFDNDRDSWERVHTEGARVSVERARRAHGLPADHRKAAPAALDDAQMRELAEDAQRKIERGAGMLAEAMAQFLVPMIAQTVEAAISKGRSDEVEVHKRGTVDGHAMDVTETHRRYPDRPGEVEVTKRGTVGGKAVNVVEIHRKRRSA